MWCVCLKTQINTSRTFTVFMAVLQVIVDGAVECGLPDDYITWLRSIPDNGYDGQVDYKNISTNF